MATYTVLIFLNPIEGKEDEFHEWYENTHVDEVLATAGFTSGQRFGLDKTIGMDMPNTHLAIYETEGESADEVMHRLNSTRDQRQMLDVIDASQVAIWLFTPLGERHVVS